jgi:PAS domain S-box-containing protein
MLSATSKGTVMIVDDMPDNLRLLSSMLKNQGYSVRALAKSPLALLSIQTDHPDIILLDVNMPELNGYQVCKLIKQDEQTRHIPVIFISALDELVNKVEAFRVGGVDYITKPFHVEEVLVRIETHLSMQHTKKSLQESEERFRLLAENAQDIIFRYRFAHPRGFEYISPAVTPILGYAPEDYYADPDFDLRILHRESLPQFGVFMESPDSYQETIIIRYIRKDGADVWVEQKHHIIYNDQQKPIAIEGISRDITSRRKAEKELQTAYANLKLLNTRIQDELHLARRIQYNLLPFANPGWAELDVACYNVPAHEIGGDLYTYYAFHKEDTSGSTEKSYAIAVGDVAGKGMPAALLMAVMMSLFRTSIEEQMPPARFLAHLNTAFTCYTRSTYQNCAMVYAEFAIQPGEMELDKQTAPSDSLAVPRATLRAANAGCVSPLVKYAQDGAVRWVDIVGIPLGVQVNEHERYQEITLPLSSGDMVIFVSDGVIEALNSEDDMFGFDQLEQAVRAGPQAHAKAMLNHLHAEVGAFMGDAELHDDMTIVVVQV